MQQFRPPEAIEQDTHLAESLASGDLDAMDALVDRYGRAVSATVASLGSSEHAAGDAVPTFVDAWHERSQLTPGTDFAPWMSALAVSGSGDASTVDHARVWDLAMAIDSIDDHFRPVLRAHHIENAELPATADRHELRLRRRLSHLGDDAAVHHALGDPIAWADPSADLSERVRAAVSPAASASTGAEGGTGPDLDDEQPVEGRVSRSLRPVLLGLAGAVTVLFVAIIALSAASGSPDPIAFSAELTPTGVIVDVEGGELTVTEHSAGLQLDLEAPTLPRRAGGEYYEGLLVLDDGTELTVGTFSEGSSVTLWGGISLDRVDVFRVVARQVGGGIDDVVLKLDVPRS